MAGRKSPTRHNHVYEQLLGRLLKLGIGGFAPTVTELKTEFNASQVTVTKALQRLQEQGFIRRPLGKKRYIVTQQAGRQEANISALRPTWPSTEFDALLLALQQECTNRHWNLAVSAYLHWEDVDMHRLMASADGIISIGHPSETCAKFTEHIEENHYPFVTLIEESTVAALSGVVADDFALGQMAVAALRELGHRRIAVLLNEPPAHSVTLRLQGWRRAMEEAGEVDLDSLVIDCSVAREEDSIELGRQRFDHWMRHHPQNFTALFATAWTGAVAAMRVLHSRHIDLPGHCSLISQGGLWPIGKYLAPALSTLDSSPGEWAKAACDLLADQISGTVTKKRVITLTPEVRLRGTTGPLGAPITPPSPQHS